MINDDDVKLNYFSFFLYMDDGQNPHDQIDH